MRIVLLIAVAGLIIGGCSSKDPRVNVREGVASDSLVSNIVTQPIMHAFSAIIGEGIKVDQAILKRNDAGVLELYVTGHNQAHDVKKFKYKVEWIDECGLPIETRTSTWLPASSMGKSPFTIKAVAPSEKAVNFRMDTKKWE